MLALLLLAQEIPLAVLRTPEVERAGIRADIVAVPKGATDDDYAAQLVAAEGLKSWSPDENAQYPASGGKMRIRAVHAANGHQIVVYYAADSRGPGHGTICRLRANRGGMTDGQYEAYRWCAIHFGMTPPDKPAPPIAGP